MASRSAPDRTRRNRGDRRVCQAGPSTRDDRPVDLADLRRRWHVEAIGVTIDGRRQLYLSYIPNWIKHPGPTLVCDGGPQFFGATIDLESGRIVSLAFNGVA